MTAHTSAAPCEFEGVKYQLDQFNKVRLAGTFLEILDARIVHAVYSAFIEAERDTWAWTKDDRTEARKGRFTVELRSGVWIGHHDDFPDVWWDAKSAGGKTTNANQVRNVLRDFKAWHATQTPPPPAVPKVGDYIRAVLGGGEVGHVEEFEVTRVDKGTAGSVFIYGDGLRGHIDIDPALADCTSDDRILSWSPTERPAPAWHMPEPGSLWELTVNGKTSRRVAVRYSIDSTWFLAIVGGDGRPSISDSITAGREVTR